MKSILIITLSLMTLSLSGCLEDPFEITGEEFQYLIEHKKDSDRKKIQYMGKKEKTVFLRIEETLQSETITKIRYAKIANLNILFKKNLLKNNKEANLNEVTERNTFLQYINDIFN